MIRNKKGELAMNTKQKAKIWKEYFDKLPFTEEPKELIKILILRNIGGLCFLLLCCSL
jgi:hypothetical protein